MIKICDHKIEHQPKKKLIWDSDNSKESNK
jgi:hypothetical protein